MKKVLIAGAGGHARSLIEVLEQSGWVIEGLIDQNYDSDHQELILQHPVVGDLEYLIQNPHDVLIGIGHLTERTTLYHTLQHHVLTDNVVHPKAVISKHASLGPSNQIFAHSAINAEVSIGTHNIFNTASVIEHNCKVGNFNHISVNTVLCGRVIIGSHCFIGAGAVIIDGLTIGDNVTIGANSVVVKDILQPGTYVGNPARKIS